MTLNLYMANTEPPKRYAIYSKWIIDMGASTVLLRRYNRIFSANQRTIRTHQKKKKKKNALEDMHDCRIWSKMSVLQRCTFSGLSFDMVKRHTKTQQQQQWLVASCKLQLIRFKTSRTFQNMHTQLQQRCYAKRLRLLQTRSTNFCVSFEPSGSALNWGHHW